MLNVALAFPPLMLLGAALAGERRTSRPEAEPDVFEDTTMQQSVSVSTWRSLGYACLVCGVFLSVIATTYWFKQDRPNEAFFVNALSLALIFVGAYRMEGGRAVARTPVVVSDAPHPLAETAIVLAILLVGGFLRTWQLTMIPYGVWFDEGQTGLEALRILSGIPFTPMGTFQAANPSLFFYITALVFKVIGPTLLAVRLVQAGTGLLTVIAFYVLLRYTLGWRAAMAGAFFLAVSSWHVNWSRFGMPYSIGAHLFEVITVYLMLRALRTKRLTTFAWAGLAFGLGLYTYFGFRLFPFALLAYVAYGFILNKENVRKNLAGLVLFAIVTVVTVLPQASWAWQHRQDFMVRMAQTSVFAGKNTPQERMAALTNSLRRHVMMLNFIGDGNGRHGIPGAPALDFVSAALFVIGLGYCLYRWRSPTYALLVIWFVVTMQAGILSLDWEAPQQHRTLVAIPAIYGMVALVIGKTWQAWDDHIRSLPSRLGQRCGTAIVAASLALPALIVGYVNYDRYFNQQMRRSDVFYSFSTVETAVARRVAEVTEKKYDQQGNPRPWRAR